jgi:hypothetical protein
LGAADRYVHPSEDRTINEHQPPRSIIPDLPPIPMDITPVVPERASVVTRDQFSIDAIAFISSAIDTYPIYGFESKSIFSLIYSFVFIDQCQQKLFYSVLIVFRIVMFL